MLLDGVAVQLPRFGAPPNRHSMHINLSESGSRSTICQLLGYDRLRHHGSAHTQKRVRRVPEIVLIAVRRSEPVLISRSRVRTRCIVLVVVVVVIMVVVVKTAGGGGGHRAHVHRSRYMVVYNMHATSEIMQSDELGPQCVFMHDLPQAFFRQ